MNYLYRRLQINIVDVDSRELVSAWILGTTASAPAAMRTYDVSLVPGSPTLKKIIFKNPWDIPRRFTVRVRHHTIPILIPILIHLLIDSCFGFSSSRRVTKPL